MWMCFGLVEGVVPAPGQETALTLRCYLMPYCGGTCWMRNFWRRLEKTGIELELYIAALCAPLLCHSLKFVHMAPLSLCYKQSSGLIQHQGWECKLSSQVF